MRGGGKKPNLNKKKASVSVGGTVTVKVKNGKKSAKVTWKTSKKSVAKITKKTAKGNKARATVKGISAGKAKITAVYKLGNKKTRLKCTVTVKKESQPVPQVSEGAPIIVPSDVPGPAATNTPEAVPTDNAEPTDAQDTPTEAPTGTPEPQATPDPNKPGIDLSGVRPLYGQGSVTYNSADNSVTGEAAADGTELPGLLIPLGMDLAAGKKVSITVYGETSVGMRMWLSDENAKRWSDIQDPAEFAKTYTFTADDAIDGESADSTENAAKWFQIKGSAYGVNFDMIKITKVVVEDPDAPTPTEASDATPNPDSPVSITIPGERTHIKQGESIQLGTAGKYEGKVKWSVTEKAGVTISADGLLAVEKSVDTGTKISITAEAEDGSGKDTKTLAVAEDKTPVLTEKQIQMNQGTDTPYGLTYRSEEAYSTVADPERGEVMRFDASQGYTSSSYDVLAWMEVDPKYAGKTVTISAYIKYEKSEDINKKLNLIINERWNYSNPAAKYNAEPDTWYHVTGTYTLPENTGAKYNGSNNRLYICRDAELTSGINAVYYIDELKFIVDKGEVTGVTVKAANDAVNVYQNHTLQFSATVKGEGSPSQEVTYSIDPAVEGASIDNKGLLTVGNVAEGTDITVKAVSVEDPKISGTATVKVKAQTIESVSVTADRGATEIYQGSSLQLRASVTSIGDPDDSVTWSIDPAVENASISDAGILTIGESVADGTQIKVKATSVFDKSKSGQYTLTVRANKVNSVTITSAGNRTTVSSDMALRLQAQLDISGNPSQDLTWSIQGQTEGASLASDKGSSNTLSVTKDVAAGTTITVRATSDFDTGKYGEITVTVESGGGETFDINKINVEYYEDFDTTGATLETIQESGVLSWKFTEPEDKEFSPTLTNASFVKVYKNFGIFKTDDGLTTAKRRTAAFQGFFGGKDDYVQFKAENKGSSEQTYTISLMFRFADIDADKSYISSQMTQNTSYVDYKLPLKLVAVGEDGSMTTLKDGIEIPFRANLYATSNKEYYDISGSVKVPAGKAVDLRLMLNGELPGCFSPDHAAKKTGYNTTPHPVSFTIDNVMISTGNVPELTLESGEDYQLNLDTLDTDKVKYYTNYYLSQFTYTEGKDTSLDPRFETVPATVDDTGKITAKEPGDTTLIAEITHQDGSIERKQCIVHVTGEGGGAGRPDEAEEFNINKLDVEYYEDFDATGATLDTIQESGVLSWKFTEPEDKEFSPTLTNASFVKVYKNFGIFKTDDGLTTAKRRTAAFQGFFGGKDDYVQFKAENKGSSEQTYTISLMFRFADIDADKSYISSQMTQNTSYVDYKLPLKLVAVGEDGSMTTLKDGIEIPFRANLYATSNKEYYDISGSVKVPAGKTVNLRLMLDGELPGCFSPDHAAKKEGYNTTPHPVSFTIDNVAISTGNVPELTIKAGEDYQLNLDTLDTDKVKYYTNYYLSQFTYTEGKDTSLDPRFETVPATVDDKGKITAKAPGDTTLIAEITDSSGSITRKQCIVHVVE